VLRYRQPERYPFLRRVLSRAAGIIVHSETSARLIRAAGAARGVHVVPLLAYPAGPSEEDARLMVRRELGLADDTILLGCFGFIGATKRMGVVLEALSTLRAKGDFRLLIVGEGEGLASDIARWGMGDRVIELGFVTEDRFGWLLQGVDILVNLRYPSMGETSATLIQAMAAGRPAVVSDHAWFAELPDDAVCKIGIGRDEADQLVAALDRLGHDRALAFTMAGRARRYVEAQCAASAVASQYVNIVAALRRLRAPTLTRAATKSRHL
jgi:glycosyltransferase involved in cell wall biosynthesis